MSNPNNISNRTSSKLKKINSSLNINNKQNQSISNIRPNTSKNSINHKANNPQENLNMDISNISQSYINLKENENNLISGRMNYNYMKNFTEELERVKSYCKEIKKSQEENCIMQNEKKTFDKMKNEFIKLSADMNILKEDMKEILTNYHTLVKRVTFMEEENKNLRKHNKCLVKLIQNRKENNNNYLDEDNAQGNYLSDYTDNFNRIKNKQNQYKNSNSLIDTNCNVYQPLAQNPHNAYSNSNYMNTMPNNHNLNLNIDNNFSTPLSDLSGFNNINNTSSNEMIANINNIAISDNNKSKKRFLIQKDNLDYIENYPLQSHYSLNLNNNMNNNVNMNDTGNMHNNGFQNINMSNRHYANNTNNFENKDYNNENNPRNNYNSNYDNMMREDYEINSMRKMNSFNNVN